jgi:hypothetical protein
MEIDRERLDGAIQKKQQKVQKLVDSSYLRSAAPLSNINFRNKAPTLYLTEMSERQLRSLLLKMIQEFKENSKKLLKLGNQANI